MSVFLCLLSFCCQICGLGSADWLIDFLPEDRNARAVAQQLLGGDLKPSRRVRGLYSVFPSSEVPKPLGPHTDRVSHQLGGFAYLDRVPAGGGGFTIWPGSHKRVAPGFNSQSNWDPNEKLGPLLAEVVADTTPLELCGSGGMVVFWHGRLVHSVGQHRGDGVRLAVPCDWQQVRPVLEMEEHAALGQYEWWCPTEIFVDDRKASDGMWTGWAIDKRPRQP